MADPTTTVKRAETYPEGYAEGKITNAEELYPGALASRLFGTGKMANMADEANAWPHGVVQVQSTPGSKTYTGTNNDDATDVGVSVRGGIVLRNTPQTPVAVTGVNGDQHIGEPVYATDGQTLTLTRPSDDAVPVGFVFDKPAGETGTGCDVFIFDCVLSWLLSSLGGIKKRLHLNPIHTTLLEGTSALTLDTVKLFGHGRIVGWGYKASGFDASYAAGDQTLNIAIGGTTVKASGGSAVTLSVAAADIDSAAEVAAPVAGDAPDSENEFHDGDDLTVLLVAGGTGFTAGVDTVSIVPFIDVVYLPGA